MTSQGSEEHKSVRASTDSVIYIVSPCRMQNELMASFLKQNFQAQCLTVETAREIPLLYEEGYRPPRTVLIDCQGKAQDAR